MNKRYTSKRLLGANLAFRWGVDQEPDWFIEAVRNNRIEIINDCSKNRTIINDDDECGSLFIKMHSGNITGKAKEGHYIVLYEVTGAFLNFRPSKFHEVFQEEKDV